MEYDLLMSLFRQSYLPGTFSAATLFFLLCATASAQRPIVIDASRPFQEPAPALYELANARSPAGEQIGLTSRYLTLDAQPWLPVSGEFHFSRYPQSRWEEEILKMKASGVNVIATYVIWIHHEEIQGQFDWAGQRDLHTFVQLCARHHMDVVLRIGPWAHGEARNGGFPDWLANVATRTNDPVYLSDVRRFYAQIGSQVSGLFWKDGGPIIAVQLENEYSRRGADAGEAHILALKKMAHEEGFDAPLFLVTGWDNAVVPERAVLPVYDGYPDAPWDSALTPWPPAEVYNFHLHSRVASDKSDQTGEQPVPFLTAEMGGGIEDTYHRRPVIQPDDVAAILPVMLGSGVNLYGTYMFQGGENPDGKLTTLQESQATGFPTDVPVKSYDFQAPLGEFGQERDSLRKMKLYQYFLNDFGSLLAPMTVSAPAQLPVASGDLATPRVTVRSRDDQGFLFFNNYVRGAAMPAQPAQQFEVRLPGGALRLPRHPVDIPSGAYFIWPFNLRQNGFTVRYSTAQLFTRLENSGVPTLYFAAVPGIPVEFALDATHTRLERVSTGKVTHQDGLIYVSGIQPSLDSLIELTSDSGAHLRLVVLSAQQAEGAWKLGSTHLLVTTQDFFANLDAKQPHFRLQSRGQRAFTFTLTPPPAAAPQASLPLTQTQHSPRTASFSALAQPFARELKYELVQPAATAPPVTFGPAGNSRTVGVAQPPSEIALSSAAKWSVTVPAGSMNGLSELFLVARYKGDLARLSSTKLLTDNFYNGQIWPVGLTRFADLSHSNRFELQIMPLRKDAPIYLEAPSRPDFPANGQVVALDQLDLVPEYELDVDWAGAARKP